MSLSAGERDRQLAATSHNEAFVCSCAPESAGRQVHPISQTDRN